MLMQLLSFGAVASAAVIPSPSGAPALASALNMSVYSLPFLANSSGRAAAIQYKRNNFFLGPDPVGNTSYFPTGPLGDQIVQADIASVQADVVPQLANVKLDAAAAYGAVATVSRHLQRVSYVPDWV